MSNVSFHSSDRFSILSKTSNETQRRYPNPPKSHLMQHHQHHNNNSFVTGPRTIMSVPSMVHRSGNGLIVRSVVSGNTIYGEDLEEQEEEDVVEDKEREEFRDLPDCKIKRNYSCSSCDFFTQNPRHFLYHLRDVHKEKVKIYECPNCIYASKHFQKLLRHAKMVHGGTDGMELPEFPRKGKKRSMPEEDVVETNSETAEEEPTVFKCSLCPFTSKGQNQLTRHEREEHIKTKFFRCTKCTYVTHMKARFTKHVKYHSMPMIKCEMCDFRTPYKWNLDRHCKNHNGNGAFRCSACNFTADIKQSLTVHEMNHHVPPVGQAAGLGVGRRRNKVGASDSVGAEETASAAAAGGGGGGGAAAVAITAQQVTTSGTESKEEPQKHQHRSKAVAADSLPSKKFTSERLKIPAKKSKSAKSQSHHGCHAFGSDFIHPDDIIHHANGNIYIKSKCKLCNFKSAWEGEMARHEQKVHNILRDNIVVTKTASISTPVPPPQPPVTTKKPTRPVPNLIPLPLKMPSRPEGIVRVSEPPPVYHPPIEEVISQKDINDICAKSANSALRDFASLFNSEDVFKTPPTATVERSPEHSKISDSSSTTMAFKRKNASFFDKLKEKLMTGAGESVNLTCQYCGHKSKCLSELAGHQKACGKQEVQIQNLTPMHNISSSRCQYCRQRCKSSTDLFVHLQTCPEAIKRIHQQELKENHHTDDMVEMDTNCEEIDDDENGYFNSNKPHPMENRVFVWNNIEVPLDIEMDNSDQNHTGQLYIDFGNDDRQEDNVSLDLSIRTQSPMSDNSYVGSETTHNNNNNNNNSSNNHNSTNSRSGTATTEKVPTHGNDIATAQVAQHKRVFKCPHCSFWASTASRFHVHIVGHLNKKPFECSLCAYRSNWRWDITKHIKLKSVRDPAHERAKVLMTDETGRRNYTKYNKYLTEIKFTGDHNETSGGAGTRPKNNNNINNNHDHHVNNNNISNSDISFNQTFPLKTELPKLTRAPSSSDFSPLLKNSPLRPPPPLKAADESFFAKISSEKKKSNNDAKKTLWKCKKCNFRDSSHEKLLNHVKGHYQQDIGFQGNNVSGTSSDGQALNNDEASEGRAILRGHAPFRCGHCHQVSNWKHVIQRHCRLKHRGDIRVLVGTKSGIDRLEVDDQTDEPDHIDVPQTGTFKCKQCPFSNDYNKEFESHLACHVASSDSIMKCYFCTFFVSEKDDLCEHLKLHGITEPEDYMLKMMERNGSEAELNKKYRCVVCPYITNSKSQFLYHKQFHKPRGGQYSCNICSYNVSKRHLLHQHLKVHSSTNSLSDNNEDVIDVDEMPEESDDGSSANTSFESQSLPDIPLVWVSKGDKISKMFKCRFCPHVNLRKVNIQEHEKMHGYREKTSAKGNEIEHRCNECNYVCNNAGVLSSHSKVHQGLYGQIHCLVDSTKSDDEQIHELSRLISLQESIEKADEYESPENNTMDTEEDEEKDEVDDSLLYFCSKCPARFLKEKEYIIHMRFHCVRLFYKCNFCTYSARQKPYLLSHSKVHTSEYQERTKELRGIFSESEKHKPPQLVIINDSEWVVLDDDKDFEKDVEAVTATSTPKHRITMNVPLSGTELFQQKSEVEKLNAAAAAEKESKQNPPLITNSVNGDPNFNLKNGRVKEKRYKCHKCPSAFEKREQYKVHLSLHGAKQRYKCEYCDYSVKYYANYAQHLKKHNAQSVKSKETEVSDKTEHPRASKNISSKRRLTANADHNALTIGNQRRSSSNNKNILAGAEEKKMFWCSNCPYVNHRKDAVENHQKRHVSVSGIENNYTCDHCDYSAPQQHFIRDHSKLHVLKKEDELMTCDNGEKSSEDMECESNDDTKLDIKEHLVMEPIKVEEVLDNINNNKGDKTFVNPENGEIVKNKKVKDEEESESRKKGEECAS